MKKLLSLNTAITGAILFLLLIFLVLYYNDNSRIDYEPVGEARIHLYGEAHGVKALYDAELKEWMKFYSEGYRDLFVELPSYEGELLNEYMDAEDEEILMYLYDSLDGTAAHTKHFLNFYRAIKAQAPETIFHGTDLGHQYFSLGENYLKHLESEGLKDSEKYARAQIVAKQGRDWYEEYDCDGDFRESKMVENFAYEYEKLIGEKALEGIDESQVKIMGIYGGYHIAIADSTVMAGMLKDKYGDTISCKYISNVYIEKNPYEMGFSYLGLIFLFMLFIPNIIFSQSICDELKELMASENKVLLVLERIGEGLATISLLFFPANNPRFLYKPGICSFYSKHFGFFVMAVILMIMYEIYWIHYFRSPKQVKDFYYPVMGVPFAGASLPCLAFFFLGLYTGNIFSMASSIILMIGHVGIHYTDYMKWIKKESDGE